VSAVTTTPHDALFKAAFTKLRHARGLLRTLVPGPLGRRFAWPTLRLESGIAVGDEELDEQRMDLVYSVQAGRGRVLIYVLAEHQSKVDPWMVFRLLCYMVAIWKGYRAQNPRAKKLPASVLRYILETSRTEPATLRELLARQVGREAAEEIMTTAEMLRREGMKEGEVLGKRGTLLLLLRQRFGRLPAAAVAFIDQAGAAELDVWCSRVLTASSLDDVLGTKARRKT
jgi:hypothetical protein